MPLIDSAEVARRLGVKRSWVYRHSAELGAIRLGSGPSRRLRFDPAQIPEPSEPRGLPVARPLFRTRRQDALVDISVIIERRRSLC
jgi:predicted DNA-binding transcriptional regulator AlpA